VAGVESNFLALMTPCVTSHLHPDLPAIMVFMEYLSALEVSPEGMKLLEQNDWNKVVVKRLLDSECEKKILE